MFKLALCAIFFRAFVSEIQIRSYLSNRSFEIDYEKNTLVKDGKPFQLISGAFHYFRVEPERWEYVLKQAKAMGLNAIESYIPWSLHQPAHGVYVFEGRYDLFKFLELVHKHGLLFIARPGPYFSAEMDLGGIPAWLLEETRMIRTRNKVFTEAASQWLRHILYKLNPLSYKDGGPVAMVQMENDYGRFHCDHDYLQFLEIIFRNALFKDIVLFTVNSCKKRHLECGGIDTVFQTVKFDSNTNVDECYNLFRKYQKKGPMLVMEYYSGWFSYWGGEHKKIDPVKVASTMDLILSKNHGVNLYMFMGGTNNGWLLSGGFTWDSKHYNDITSYEYDGPLDESGNPRAKFFAIREVLKKYIKTTLPDVLPALPLLSKTKISFSHSVSLGEAIPIIRDDGEYSLDPLSMEKLKYYTGYLVYSNYLTSGNGNLTIDKISDFATVCIGDEAVASFRRNHGSFVARVTIQESAKLNILLGNDGRPNVGVTLYDSKGIEGVRLNNELLLKWTTTGILRDSSHLKELTNLLRKSSLRHVKPGFFLAEFELTEKEILDTYVYLHGFQKGIIYVNENHIGRYDIPQGPQITLFAAKSYFIKGSNKIIVFETEGITCSNVSECHISLTQTSVWK